MSPIFFVHIPKTAGTSFRKAAEQFFSSERVFYDYSPTEKETSSLVCQWIYKERDFLSFYQELCNKNASFLSGHVNASKYVYLFGACQTVTFVRDPVQRIVSEYQHFVRHHGYEGDLPSFYRKPQFINRQSKILQGVPLEAIGFLGLNEAYEDSLAILNQRYNFDIQSIDMNMGRTDKTTNYELPKEQLEELNYLNQQDIRLYRMAVRLFEQRRALFNEGKSYVHGAIHQLSDKSTSGWAWHAKNDSPVKVSVLINGKKIATLSSKDLRPAFLRLGLPRSGYVGFHYNFEAPLIKGSVVEVVVPETGQLLGKRRVQ
ncbi:sulfotransferase family protein [Halomonas qinghailakensis]|uniref:Sulfotransferase family protein n=1 Tax=Halomonas qinghailakensis TaxID=2937790 RepID=A0AA46TP04_9GAMM|nr:sulfotransferase family protein [Halomonas sp. ZZQ-149]UYO73893.1 sulfotransferase family protein [Halomonas sp. ZZQ-149]